MHLTCHKILFSPLRGSGHDTVSSWEKTPSLLENHEKCIFSMLRCVAKILPILIRRCIYWCQSAEMEISPTCSYHWQHSVAWENSSAHPGRTEVIHLLRSIRQQALAVTHPSVTNLGGSRSGPHEE